TSAPLYGGAGETRRVRSGRASFQSYHGRTSGDPPCHAGLASCRPEVLTVLVTELYPVVAAAVAGGVLAWLGARAVAARTLAEVEKDRAVAGARLDEQIRALGAGLSSLTGETGNLVRALRQPHVRGHWGEVQLRRVVELAGMLDHCDFVEQQTTMTETGRIR